MTETITLVSHPGSRSREGFGPKTMELVDMPADFIHDGHRYALDADGGLWRGTDIRDALGDVEVDGSEVRFDGNFDPDYAGCFPRPTRLTREADGTLLLWFLLDGHGVVVLQRHDHTVREWMTDVTTTRWTVQRSPVRDLLQCTFTRTTHEDDRYSRRPSPTQVPSLADLGENRTSLTVAEAIKHGIVTAGPGWNETIFDVHIVIAHAMVHAAIDAKDTACKARELADMLEAMADGDREVDAKDVTRYGQVLPTFGAGVDDTPAKLLQRLRVTSDLWDKPTAQED